MYIQLNLLKTNQYKMKKIIFGLSDLQQPSS